jgi:uncharacterized protein
MKVINWIAVILVIVGGLNWGLVGVVDYNLVESIFGLGTSATALVYDLVGLSALYSLFRIKSLV